VAEYRGARQEGDEDAKDDRGCRSGGLDGRIDRGRGSGDRRCVVVHGVHRTAGARYLPGGRRARRRLLLRRGTGHDPRRSVHRCRRHVPARTDEGSVPTGTIGGGVRAANPASVEIHFATIDGGIHVSGGSGAFGGPFDVTFIAIEDNVVHGGASVVGYDGFWFGFIRNHVSGSVTLNDNVLSDPDGNEYVTNTIHGSLKCSGNSPAPQPGDSEGLPNVVTGQKIGQCSAV
jgi:hypothetical protein